MYSFLVSYYKRKILKEALPNKYMKPKIYATGNETIKGENNISYYVFEKDNSFLDWLTKLLREVFEIQDAEQQVKFFIKRKEDEGGNWIEDEIYLKDIGKMIDLHEKYSNKVDRIDVFYGKERVYVTLRKSGEIKRKFSKFVLKTKDWIKVKEVLELPVYIGKRVNEKEV